MAQRLDLKVTILKEGGAYPILAQGEGTKLLCGVVLVTKGASVPQLSRTAAVSTAALDNTQEKKLRAVNPLPDHPIDRVLQAALGGNMGTYVWTINEAAYPNRKSLDIRKGERVGIAFSISTNMGHPMHLHGHDFQVVEIDGEKISGALRDTLMVPPGSRMTVALMLTMPASGHCIAIYSITWTVACLPLLNMTAQIRSSGNRLRRPRHWRLRTSSV